VMSRYAVAARVTGLAVSVAASLILVVLGAPVVAFAVAAALEFIVSGAGYLVAYLRLGRSPFAWTVSLARARNLLSFSWPLIVSGVFNAVNLRIDQLMLGNMRGVESVGSYAAAARLSEVWYFVPLAIATSVFPALIASREEGKPAYQRRVQRLMDLMVWLSLPIAILVAVASGLIINVLYGARYADAAPMLAVHVWAGPFVFMGALLSKWLIAENLLKFSFVRHGVGAVVNVVANLLLIPVLGGLGAAIATLISYATASYLACFLYRPTWPIARAMSWALVVPLRTLSAVAVRGRGTSPS
jgi:O-antigen/teichoic acid export membrane protein